jgi:hypothetical protein
MMRAKFALGYALYKEGLAPPKPVAKVPAKVRRSVERRGDCSVLTIGDGTRKAWRKAKGAGRSVPRSVASSP